MDTYTVLRQLDYLRTAIDNLMHEAFRLLPASTKNVQIIEKLDDSLPALFRKEISRIDGLAEALSNYKGC
jgi:hypothetical protein